MAEITIKRKTSGGYEELYPTTTIVQVTGLQTALDAKIASTEKGAANGVATLGSDSKVPIAQLPSAVIGGMRFVGVAELSAGNSEANAVAVSTLGYSGSTFADLVNAGNYSTTGESQLGSYMIVNSAGWVKGLDGNTTTPTAYYRFSSESSSYPPYTTEIGEEGDNASPIYLERGDWIVLQGRVSPASNAYYYLFGIINNTYGDATTTAQGIVTLSDGNSGSTSGLTGNTVITEGNLAGLLTADGTDLYNSGTPIAGKIAPSSHTHSQYQPLDSDLTAIAGLAVTDSNFIVGNGTTWVVESGATARTSLGLAIGTNVQAYDAGLQSISGLTTAANNMIYTTASDTYAVATLTAAGRAILDDADAAAQRTTLGLAIGTNVQAWDADLDTLAGLAKTDGNFIVGDGSTWVVESGSTARASLGVYSTTEVDNKFTNRPQFFYDTTSGIQTGDYLFDDDATA